MTQAAVYTLHAEGFTGGLSGIVAKEPRERRLATIQKEEVSRGKKGIRSWDMHQGVLHTHLQDRRKLQEKKKCRKRAFYFKMPCACFWKKKAPTMMHHSARRKHRSCCLQKQKCFIIRGPLLTKTWMLTCTVSCFCQDSFPYSKYRYFTSFCQAEESVMTISINPFNFLFLPLY